MTFHGWASSFCYIDINDITDWDYNKPIQRHFMHPVPEVFIYASTANPFSEAARFAVATSHGATVLKESQGRWTDEVSRSHSDKQRVIAVDWLSPNIVIKGCKDGGVRLWDVRSRGESRRSRIQHPSQIKHARRIDENTIVVAGLRSQVNSLHRRWFLGLLTCQVV